MSVTQQQLQAHLWESANILRGSIDSSDYKNYIFGMMFLKRLSDVFEDEYNAVVSREVKRGRSQADAEAIADDPDEHQFYVPPRARWSAIRAIEAEAARLREVKRGLMQGLLSGQIRV
jgi:type I restriction enzyme M protein